MRRHFRSRHSFAGVRFPGEGELVSCPHCDLKVLSLDRHIGSKVCEKAAERARKRCQVTANREADQVVFTIGDQPIQKVSTFKYLGRILSANDDDLPAVVANVRCARQRWGQVAQLLVREGASTATMSYFYKAVVQAVLLYGSATWVMSPRLFKVLDSFHHRCARYLAHDHIRQNEDGSWYVPSSCSVLEKCKLHSIEEYITRCKETLKGFVGAHQIFHSCLQSRPTALNVHQLVWW